MVLPRAGSSSAPVNRNKYNSTDHLFIFLHSYRKNKEKTEEGEEGGEGEGEEEEEDGGEEDGGGEEQLLVSLIWYRGR